MNNNLDADLLTKADSQVQNGMEHHKINLNPQQKAKAVIVVYALLKGLAEKGEPADNINYVVKNILRVAATSQTSLQ